MTLKRGQGYGKLLQAKFEGAREGLIEQAQRQIAAAGGLPIEWRFAEQGAALKAEEILAAQGIVDIDVTWMPEQKPR